MKFLFKNNFYNLTKINYSNTNNYSLLTYNDVSEDIPELSDFFSIEYSKKVVLNRKILLNIKKGLTKSEKKNSLKRDKNNTILQQYINIAVKNGNKSTFFKHFNMAVDNFYFILNNENDEFYKYKNYLIYNFLVNNFMEYNDFNFILENSLKEFFSMFDIKTIKSRKKSKTLKKYTHQIFFIPENKRLKNLLKVLNAYSEGFKNYNLWERLFWLFIILITDKKRTNLIKRRNYIYKKSIKFFKNNKNK